MLHLLEQVCGVSLLLHAVNVNEHIISNERIIEKNFFILFTSIFYFLFFLFFFLLSFVFYALGG